MSAALAAPSVRTAWDAANSAVTLSWNAVDGATGYEYRWTPGRNYGGDQLDDDRGPAADTSRPVAPRRQRGTVDLGVAGRPARDLPSLAGRAGDERLRAGPDAAEGTEAEI